MLKRLKTLLLDMYESYRWSWYDDGRGAVLRRRVAGGWEYRSPTREESAEAVEQQTW
jgi:hypothetical protein